MVSDSSSFSSLESGKETVDWLAQQESGGSNVQTGDTDGQDNPSQEGAITLTFPRSDHI